jgi:hypothetical protein
LEPINYPKARLRINHAKFVGVSTYGRRGGILLIPRGSKSFVERLMGLVPVKAQSNKD